MPNLKSINFNKGPRSWALIFLLPLSWLYVLGFTLVRFWRQLHGGATGYPFKIISVGNLTVGGTGKSVVVRFLADLLGPERCTIILRGYRGSNERTGQSLLVSDGKHLFAGPDVAGDEAIMHAAALPVRVVVGADRKKSCDLLAVPIEFAILDDAYQNFAVKKDLEILLLDARAPLDNGWCLPAGRLRERDLSRADLIILTHANEVDADVLEEFVATHLDHKKDHVVMGKHEPAGVFLYNDQLLPMPSALASTPLLLCAGVGSFAGVRATARASGLVIAGEHAFNNHHNYTSANLDYLRQQLKVTGCQAVLTTEKDWVKLAPLVLEKNACILRDALRSPQDERVLQIYVLRVAFACMTPEGYESLREHIAVLS